MITFTQGGLKLYTLTARAISFDKGSQAAE